jgi:3-(3-hydroxy-phenyl)propionate hydroxylase
MSIGLGQIANMHDPGDAAQRDAAFKAGKAPPPPAMPAVTGGVVHHQPDGAVAPPAGSLVPQGRVTAGGRTGRFDDVAGGGFALVSTVDVASALTGEQRRFLDSLGCRVVRLGTGVTDEDGLHAAYLQQLGAVAYLARPDFVLFGAATDAAAAGALVDELQAALTWTAAVSG